MDDVQAFVNIKMEEYLLTKNKADVSNITDGNLTELNKYWKKSCKDGIMKYLLNMQKNWIIWT